MKKAFYPGSFDPITYGHIDVIQRASQIFDHIVISVLDNPEKTTLFTLAERLALIKETFSDQQNVSVEGFQGLLVDYATKSGIYTVIRGLRVISDFDFEFQMAVMNRKLNMDVDTVFFMTDEKYSYLSSSLVKQVVKYGGEVSKFVPSLIEAALKGKMTI